MKFQNEKKKKKKKKKKYFIRNLLINICLLPNTLIIFNFVFLIYK